MIAQRFTAVFHQPFLVASGETATGRAATAPWDQSVATTMRDGTSGSTERRFSALPHRSQSG